MVELPEAVTLARQMDETLRGKMVLSAIQGQTLHKWVFYNREAAEFEGMVEGKTVGRVRSDGKYVLAALEPGLVLRFGDIGGRFLYHADSSTLPEKHHLLLSFTDGSAFTISVQGWGFIGLLDEAEVPETADPWILPQSEGFTPNWLAHRLSTYEDRKPKDRNTLKHFLISGPGVAGLGNGYAQDILFRAGLHPRRWARDLNREESDRLYAAIKAALEEAIRGDGRHTERDLFGRPGRYVPTLDVRSKDGPCPRCGTTIERVTFIVGGTYFCPTCQS